MDELYKQLQIYFPNKRIVFENILGIDKNTVSRGVDIKIGSENCKVVFNLNIGDDVVSIRTVQINSFNKRLNYAS